MQISTAVAVVIAAVSALPSALGHSYLAQPVARDNYVHTDIENSMGCPTNNKGQVTEFKAGETIDVRYWRNNHLGGFIRWAIVPAGEESAENFDNNAFFYTCRESGATCVPNGENKWYSGDNSGDFTISCGDKITLPDYLPEGDYTMQWMWFGVGSSYGNIGWAEPQFKSCADIKLTTSGAGSKPACPAFVGGDRVTKIEGKGDDVCFYFHDNNVMTTQFKTSNEGADAHYKYAMPGAVEQCLAANGGNNGNDATDELPSPGTVVPAPEPSTVPEPTPAPPVTSVPSADPTSTPAPSVNPEPSSTPAPPSGEPSSAPTPSSNPSHGWKHPGRRGRHHWRRRDNSTRGA